MYVCLFDIDGTLVSSSGAGRLAMDAALESEFGVRVPIRAEDIAGRTDRSIASEHFRRHGIADTEENWQRFMAAYLRFLPESLKRNAGRLLPGIDGLLERLSAEPGVVLGLLTGNVPRGAEIKLGHCNIYHYFRFGAFGDRRQTRDDVARDAFARVQEHFGRAVPAGQVLVIGDTPSDVRCARAIGGTAVAVATGLYSLEALAAEQPDLLLPDFSDPGPLLRCCRL